MTATVVQPTAAPATRTVTFRARQRASTVHRPLTGHVAPWPVTTLLWAAAAVGHSNHTATQVVAVAAPVIAVVWWWKWSRRRSREQRRARRLHAAAVTIAAAAWLAWAMHAGAGGWRGAALWVGMYALMAPYWARRRIPIPAEVVDVPPVVVEGDVVEKWVERVQCKGGALPGAYLLRHERVRNGEAWDIHLVPGQQVTAQAVAAQPRIVSALDHLTIDQVIVDRHPSGSLARARLVVVQGHPLNRNLYHPGPSEVYNPETGYAAIGMHPDEEPAEWAFFIPGWGLAGGFVVGGIGSGKSKLMLNLATTACHTGYLTIWAGCPVGGQSFPDLIKHASWSATDVPEIVLQLRAAVKLIRVRGIINSLRGRDLHIPTDVEPGVLLFLDEFHKITSGHKDYKEAAALLSLVTREGRKACVAAVGADQDFDLQGVFANDDTLRTSIRAKNLWVGRTPSHVLKGMITGLDVDPSSLPERFPDGSITSGLGYLVGGRTAPMRCWHPQGAEEMLAAAPKYELERSGAKLAGDDYLTRHERALQAKAEMAAALGVLDESLLIEILDANPDLRSIVDQLGDRMDAVGALAGTAWAMTGGPAEAGADPLPGDIPDAPRFEYEEPAEVVERQTVRDKVLTLVRDGVQATGELQARTGASETAVRNALNELVDAGDIVRLKKGVYAPAARAA